MQALNEIPFSQLTYHHPALGQGGFGTVYKADYLTSQVAVKEIFVNSKFDSFKREAEVLSKLRHPSIVTFIGISINEKTQAPAIVMEYLPKTLTNLLISKNELPWIKRYQIALDISQGLCYLHTSGVLHLDLKSDNILIDENFRAKLADFGTACLKTENSTFGSHAGNLSERYTPPEVLDEDNPKNTKAIDMYSFGWVLWQLDSREKCPFPHIESAHRAAHKALGGERGSFSSEIPTVLAYYVTCCWNGNPLKRPSIYEVIWGLETEYMMLYKPQASGSKKTADQTSDSKEPAVQKFLEIQKNPYHSDDYKDEVIEAENIEEEKRKQKNKPLYYSMLEPLHHKAREGVGLCMKLLPHSYTKYPNPRYLGSYMVNPWNASQIMVSGNRGSIGSKTPFKIIYYVKLYWDGILWEKPSIDDVTSGLEKEFLLIYEPQASGSKEPEAQKLLEIPKNPYRSNGYKDKVIKAESVEEEKRKQRKEKKKQMNELFRTSQAFFLDWLEYKQEYSIYEIYKEKIQDQNSEDLTLVLKLRDLKS